MLILENSELVVSDVIDGETMILNMEAGNYYNLSETAASLWQAIRECADEEKLLQALLAAFPQEDKEELSQDFQAFLNSLKEEKLVIETDKVGEPAVLFAQLYTSPKIQRYTDLQDLLLIDPIHEADESGWPATPAKS